MGATFHLLRLALQQGFHFAATLDTKPKQNEGIVNKTIHTVVGKLVKQYSHAQNFPNAELLASSDSSTSKEVGDKQVAMKALFE